MKRLLTSLILISVVGCKTVPAPEPVAVKPAASSTRLESVIDHTQDSVSDIIRDSDAIVAKSESVKGAVDTAVMSPDVPEVVKPPLRQSAETMVDVKNLATSIKESATEIEKETETLRQLHVQVDKLEDQIISLQSAMAQTQAQALEKLYGYITMFWVIGFILIVAGAAVAFFVNKGYGASLGLIGILMIGFASASQYYMQEIAMVGAIIVVLGFLIAVGMIVWSAINSKRNSTAIKEIVEMVEILKETMTDSEKDRIFGEEGIAQRIQSDFTKEVIAKIKERNGFKSLKEIREGNMYTGSNDKSDEKTT